MLKLDRGAEASWVSTMKAYILARLCEPSTWRGIVLFATGIAGFSITTAEVDALISVGLTLAGAIGALSQDVPKS